MTFVDISFLAFFAVIMTLFAAASSVRARLWILALASYVFYAWWDWRFVPLLAFTTLAGYVGGMLIARRPSWLAAAIVTILAPLIFFKYAVFILDNLSMVLAVAE